MGESPSRHIQKLLMSFLKKRKPGQILVMGFLAVILTGTVLLMLPVATADRYFLGFIDSLFTATSAVCVTGLVVVNTGVTFSLFGQIVIIVLIQIGGLGFMTMTSLIFMAIGRRISLRERMIIQESFNSDSLQGMVRLVRNAILVTLITEGTAAVILSIRLIPELGVGEGLFNSIFLAISAFCNAGFDVLGQANSIQQYGSDPVINFTIMALIVIGGLGFSVIVDIRRHHSFRRLTLHSKIVLVMSAGMIVGGALLFGLLEWNNPQTLGNPEFSVPEKMMAAVFQSVTTRTAGFDTIGQAGLTPAGKMASIVWMFIGASPASTGGGIKTTTFFVILLSVAAMIRRHQDYNIHGRRLNEQVIRRALSIFAIALGLIVFNTMLVSAAETMTGDPQTLENILFEVTSAFGTVGLSANVTPSLCAFSKLLITFTMFCGRLGPLTISMALSGGPVKPNAIRYPEDRIMVG